MTDALDKLVKEIAEEIVPPECADVTNPGHIALIQDARNKVEAILRKRLEPIWEALTGDKWVVRGGPMSCPLCGVIHASWCPKRDIEEQMMEKSRALGGEQ